MVLTNDDDGDEDGNDDDDDDDEDGDQCWHSFVNISLVN